MKNALKEALQYREQNSPQTLREGLGEYYAANPAFNVEGFLSMPRDVIEAHDVCHVVFGCAATSADELVVETWTFFGTYIPARKYVAMAKDGVVGEVARTFGLWRMARRFALSLPRVLRALLATRRLRKKWPHFGYQQFWDVPLCDLRRDFNIRVV